MLPIMHGHTLYQYKYCLHIDILIIHTALLHHVSRDKQDCHTYCKVALCQWPLQWMLAMDGVQTRFSFSVRKAQVLYVYPGVQESKDPHQVQEYGDSDWTHSHDQPLYYYKFYEEDESIQG